MGEFCFSQSQGIECFQIKPLSPAALFTGNQEGWQLCEICCTSARKLIAIIAVFRGKPGAKNAPATFLKGDRSGF